MSQMEQQNRAQVVVAKNILLLIDLQIICSSCSTCAISLFYMKFLYRKYIFNGTDVEQMAQIAFVFFLETC